MFTCKLPPALSSEFLSLIPEQRKVVKELMEKNLLISYTLSSDRSTLWMLIESETEAEAMLVASQLPLNSFMEHEIKEVMFHHSMDFSIPQPSLN